MPAGVASKRHKTIEATDIMPIQLVTSVRGMVALLHWLVGEYRNKADVIPMRL